MDISTLQTFEQSANKSIQWLLSQLKDEGSLGKDVQDIRGYFRAPYLFQMCGYTEQAHRVLTYIEKVYKDKDKWPNKDDLTVVEGMLALGAHRLNRFDVSFAKFQYLRSFYDPEQGAFTACAPYGQGEAVLDFASTAMLGLVFLTFGDTEKVKRAGSFLQRMISLQHDGENAFYFRMDDDGKLITSYPDEHMEHIVVVANKSNQPLERLGFAVGVLGKISLALQDKAYLRAAQSLQNFTQYYQPAHSAGLAWGASVLANITQEQRYVTKAIDLALEVVSQQKDGFWCDSADMTEGFALSAHNALYLKEVVCELSAV